MAELSYSAAAERDLADIGAYTLRTWGEDQSVRYLDALQDCCEQLVSRPMLGRACDEVRPGLRRIQ